MKTESEFTLEAVENSTDLTAVAFMQQFPWKFSNHTSIPGVFKF